MRTPLVALALCWASLSCAPPPPSDAPADVAASPNVEAFSSDAVATKARYQSREVPLGEPLGVVVDFPGRVVIADGSPGRLVRWAGTSVVEFQEPSTGVGFYPTDVAIHGFFVYAVDESGREILRFDDQGHYRDVLLNFERLDLGRRVSPYSIAVDASGRIAVSDIENDQILIFDNYLTLEVAFGNYGTYEGQLSSPMGVGFGPRGEIVVADTGNRRVQIFTPGGGFARAVPAPGQPNPLKRPRRAAVDSDGRVLVADPQAGGVFVFDARGGLERVVTPAGIARFEPTDIEVTRGGMIYVTDEANHTVHVFERL